TTEQDGSARGSAGSGHDRQQGRLARSVVSNERDDLSWLHGKVDAGEGGDGAEAHLDVAKFQHGHAPFCSDCGSPGARRNEARMRLALMPREPSRSAPRAAMS